MMKATPRASFVVGIESGLSDEKADEIVKIVQAIVKGMADSPVKISFQRHFTYQDERPTGPFSVSY
ncbi:hypothetical protein J7W19_29265 [Streptomyces mobaraensis NBRC 13819 = DSM 40847]|uniref:4-oxalocrotonate tautomerase domain-containing protein n=1 Tax=Streptomyces mobaraensis (strain ATCC 29032 / DSM 40847 / JCM 4168 / NBRC 13819 / NCIMB 11159 / IPCR 16-22) TaxID=1223523 RepID=M3BRW9_STRM1|nr:hypothetical protein [Streptomyces mobaraensis]EMF02420.1 hypothetical protein H340_01199 [Streptomyces mobaraensis NBRC 13819 = DSM 40847]QTT76929.1 hypothetical protein J7W19_29265 [Streptomyces mobaraensis NBRC 13819 = DSM 40847]